jgi:hypothetical protein
MLSAERSGRIQSLYLAAAFETNKHLRMSDSTLLCPGYKQVHEFGADEEYEDEEVEYVTLDLGHIEPTLIPTSTEYCLIVSC